MTQRVQYTVLGEPAGPTYDGLLRTAVGPCRELWLVVRSELPLSEQARRVLQRLRPFLMRAEAQAEWPGTRLLGRTATVYRHRLTTASAEIVRGAAGRLYAWAQPHLPEDLALLARDGTPWLATISHERDAFLRLTDDEATRLLTAAPGLALARDTPLPPPGSPAR